MTDSVDLPTVLVVFMSRISDFERRTLIRFIYFSHVPHGVTVKFAVGLPETKEERDILTREMQMYNDILALDVKENMNEGKTYALFKHLGDHEEEIGIRVEFVMKTDLDSFVHLENVQKRLSKYRETGHTYLGRQLTHMAQDSNGQQDPIEFMGGMGFVLSWDLVREISQSTYARDNQNGYEDVMVGLWIRQFASDRVNVRWVNVKTDIYDHPETGRDWAHVFTKSSLVVHLCKETHLWLSVARHYYPSSSKDPIE